MKTKEDITFAEHTLGVVRYAAEKGMRVNVTTNGDYVKEDILEQLRDAGVDMLTFSLHTLTNPGLDRLIKGARMATDKGIIADINVVFTNDRVDILSKIAAKCAENGVLFSTSVVQEYEGGFSSVPEHSKIPTPEQQREVFEQLFALKRSGFVRNSTNYLTDAPEYPENSWRCSPEQDAFAYMRSEGEGEIGVCLEAHTDYKIGDTQLDDEKWRRDKRSLVANCNNFLYNGTFGTQNSTMRGEMGTYTNMLVIKAGQAERVEERGKRAVANLRKKGVLAPVSGAIFSK